jgi:GT2 family glycosyltransferase
VINKLGPAISVFWATAEKQNFKVRSFEFGQQVKAPSVSVIIPLYVPLNFMRFQLSQFADDTDWKNVELIFVLQDVGPEDDLLRWCDQLESLFGIPLKVLFVSAKLGHARANNLAAESARADLLLLLHPDVLPTASGWLHTLINAYAELPNVGVLGARLLEHDQRAEGLHLLPLGMQSQEQRFARRTIIQELAVNRPEFPVEQVVSAISGACLMVGRALYLEIGGLDEDFIMGVFSDDDFCRKSRIAGKINYQLENLALYHLKQRTRYSLENAPMCQFIIAYNRWLSAHRPTPSIESLPYMATDREYSGWHAYPCN